MFDIVPCYDIKAREDTLRMAEKEGLLVIYTPHQDEFKVLRDLSGYSIEMIALDTRRVIIPSYEVKDGVTEFKMARINEDMLIIARRT